MARNYQVIVGNIGKVYDGGNEYEACTIFDDYALMSEQAVGSAAGEDVVLMMGEKILRELIGYNKSNE